MKTIYTILKIARLYNEENINLKSRAQENGFSELYMQCLQW